MTSFKISNGNLYFKGALVPIPFNGKAAQGLVWRDLFVLRFELRSEKYINNNVIAFNPDGTIKWTIEPKHLGPDGINPYMNIWLDSNDRLLAGAYVGYDFFVDYRSGEVINANPGARPW